MPLVQFNDGFDPVRPDLDDRKPGFSSGYLKTDARGGASDKRLAAGFQIFEISRLAQLFQQGRDFGLEIGGLFIEDNRFRHHEGDALGGAFAANEIEPARYCDH